ncbi:MAG TPA: hypothetical protein VGF16_20160 [Bryobacteraceae bacterium]|jgi:hypothetical protein
MIYTCYDMIRDCRADRPEGWSYFVSHYVPVIRKLAAHYFPDQPLTGSRTEEILVALRQPQSSLFQSLEPAPERWFVAQLRQRVLAALSAGGADEAELDLDTLGKAMGPLTLLEKQAVWLETMRYTPEQSGVLLRMDPRTVEKIRSKAAELLRAELDNWRRSLLADQGAPLGRAASAAHVEACLPPKAFLDVLDGRTTWYGREELERHVAACWHCIDHFCRLAEVIELLRGLAPLSDEEAEPLRTALGLPRPKKRGLGRWLGA